MCDKDEIKTIIELAKKLEKTDVQEAARQYFIAADLLVKGAGHHTGDEKQYMMLAQQSYLRGKELKEKGQQRDTFSEKKRKGKGTYTITFDDIGGLEELKAEIRLKIIEPFAHPDLFHYYGKKAGGGILMYGPPGCGKSLIAKATAAEAGAQFIHVKSSDLKSKFVGETEKNIEELFERSREQTPTIIFFDEFESIGSDRSDAPAHDKSAVAQLLTEMDGMDAKEGQILLLAATNEPWSVDAALRREGRFGTTLFIPPPDVASRQEILEIILAKRPTLDIDYKKLAELTEGFSGADLKAVCEMATDIPLKESLETGTKREIRMDDLMTAIKNTKSVLRQWFAKAAEQVRRRKLEEEFGELIDCAQKMEVVAVSC